MKLGAYRHRNGSLYEVISVARSSNDCEQELVIYKSLEDTDFPKWTIWVRPKNDFMKEGRFEYADEERDSSIYCQKCFSNEETMQDENNEYVCSNCYEL